MCEKLRITIDHSDLGDGSYDFAVSSISEFGIESDLHTSLDYTAVPIGGWYILWVRSD